MKRGEPIHPRESGQSLLEFAIVLPILLALLVGIFEFGVAWNRKQVLTNAAREGAHVLNEGDSAVDAAVCMGFVLAVTHPAAGNLGGGGFLLVHTERGDIVIDCRETAPRAAQPGMFLDEKGEPIPDASLIGPLASGVPGSVAGYLRLLADHGTMDRNAAFAGGAEWAMTLPNARLIVARRAAHQLWLDRPQAFGEIDRFLGGRWPENAVRVRSWGQVRTHLRGGLEAPAS